MKTQTQATRRLARGAVIAALYTALTLLLAPISYGQLQVRLSEALTLLPILLPETVPALAIGCLLSNILGGCTIFDIVFGTLATLMACLVTYKLRNVRIKGLAIPASLPPVVFNMIIVGAFEITFFFSDGAPTAALAAFNAVTVGIGEIISCTVLGVALVKLIESNDSLHKIFTEE